MMRVYAAIALLAVAAAPAAPRTALDAERAFDATAARDGQWTAFRAYADPGAIMFVPRPVNAQAWLKGRPDPARSVRWQPVSTYVACDGRWAVNFGRWQRPDGSRGYFTTVWHHGARGWRWVLAHGDVFRAPRVAPDPVPPVRHAACGGEGRTIGKPADGDSGVGASNDATLRWAYAVAADGARTVHVELWTGARYDTVIDEHVPAPSP